MGKATHVSRITDGQARKEARDTLKLGRRRTGRRFRVLGDPARPRGTATALTIPAQPLPSRPLKTQGTNNTAPGAKPGRRRTKHGLSNQRMSSPHHSQKKPKLSASSSPTGEPTRTSTMRRSLAPSRRAPDHRRCARLGRPRFNLSGRTSQVRRCVSFRLTIPVLITRESSLNLESIETNLQFSKLLKAIVQQLIVFPINA